MKQKQILIVLFVTLGLFLLFLSSPAFADDDRNFAYISQGFFRILTAAFQIPRYLVQKTLSEPPGIGTIDGAITGTFHAVAELSRGVLEIARGVAPYGKYMFPFFL